MVGGGGDFGAGVGYGKAVGWAGEGGLGIGVSEEKGSLGRTYRFHCRDECWGDGS